MAQECASFPPLGDVLPSMRRRTLCLASDWDCHAVVCRARHAPKKASTKRLDLLQRGDQKASMVDSVSQTHRVS